MKAADLDYDLPEERIAQEPLAERDASRLLVLCRATGALEHARFSDLPDLLAPGDVVVRNVSRVLPARLLARRPAGGRVELLLVEEAEPERWRALARPARRLRPGERLRLESGDEVTITGRQAQGWVDLAGRRLRQAIDLAGRTPLPPYIRRPPRPEDRDRYQTVYARTPGSVAAPTAGLHFTPALLDRLQGRGVAILDVVLHIGPATFLPVRAESFDDLVLPAEPFEVSEETTCAVRAAAAAGHRVVAVGTSVVRALETAARGGTLRPVRGTTDLLILPGFPFRAVGALLTNFHQPRSTLLALVAAFAGLERVRTAYQEALRTGYRFLSYGDAMLIG